MKAASVTVSGQVVADAGPGLVVFVGAMDGDAPEDVEFVARKVCELRIFPDDEGQMNLSVEEAGGSVLLVPNFTVGGDCRKGRRPSFSHAASADDGRDLFRQLVEAVDRRNALGGAGVFGAEMVVSVDNNGPVTILLDSRRQF
jgi:D-tyrosyl-tRNA(Tyr) deacylase